VKLQEWIQAYGTSEGASKGWDARGRGRKVNDKGGMADSSRRYHVIVKNPVHNNGKPFVHRTFHDKEEAKTHARGVMGDLPHLTARVKDTQKGASSGTKIYSPGGKSRTMSPEEKRRIDETHIKDSET
jgi:hypothetical protein